MSRKRCINLYMVCQYYLLKTDFLWFLMLSDDVQDLGTYIAYINKYDLVGYIIFVGEFVWAAFFVPHCTILYNNGSFGFLLNWLNSNYLVLNRKFSPPIPLETGTVVSE